MPWSCCKRQKDKCHSMQRLQWGLHKPTDPHKIKTKRKEFTSSSRKSRYSLWDSLSSRSSNPVSISTISVSLWNTINYIIKSFAVKHYKSKTQTWMTIKHLSLKTRWTHAYKSIMLIRLIKLFGACDYQLYSHRDLHPTMCCWK